MTRDAISCLKAWSIKFRQGKAFCPYKSPAIPDKSSQVYEWQQEAVGAQCGEGGVTFASPEDQDCDLRCNSSGMKILP